MFCALSGQVPEEPVVSKTTGYIFEKRLIAKYLSSEGKCPVTGTEMTEDDLMDIKSSATVKPRPVSATSIPGLISMLQSEWDSVMLESFALKKHLQAVRQELSQALYQHEAACRVIARLIKERDAAREALSLAQSQPVTVPAVSTSEQVEVRSEQVPAEVVTKMSKCARDLFRARPKRTVSEDLCPLETVSKWSMVDSYTIHMTNHPQLTTVCARDAQPGHVLTAGADGQALLYNMEEKQVIRSFTGHSKTVTCAVVHPTMDVTITGSTDKTVRLWTAGEKPTIFKVHSSEITGLSLHATGSYFASCESNGTWGFFDVASATCLCKIHGEQKDGLLTRLRFHPDGLIMATSTDKGIIQMWDMKQQQVVAYYSEHTGAVKDIAFSENGVHMASCGEDGTVRIWDLRNGDCIQKLDIGHKVHSVAFDYSGSYMGVGSEEGMRIFNSSDWNKVYSHDNKAAHGFNSIWFGPNAQFVYAACGDRTLRKFSA